MRAVVIGATSSVGHALVEALARSDAWTSICIVVRKPTDDFAKIVGSEKVTTKVLADLDNLQSLAWELEGYDAMFCSLGAYLKMDGPELVEKVDFTYVVAAATLAEQCKIASFSLVSAGGANADLPEDSKGFMLYLRTKGRAERAVLEKAIARIYVYRPGILFGRHSTQATGSTRSKGSWDTFVACLNCCCCCLVASTGVHIKALAQVMVARAERAEDAVKATIDNDEIHKLYAE